MRRLAILLVAVLAGCTVSFTPFTPEQVESFRRACEAINGVTYAENAMLTEKVVSISCVVKRVRG